MDLNRVGVTPKSLLGIGNALLDITADVNEDFLTENGIKTDQAIRGDPAHFYTLLKSVKDRFPTRQSAGGCCLNVLRTVQWILGKDGICTFMGSIGNDESGEFLLEAAKKSGVRMACQVIEGSPTGACVVLITGNQRSMCSYGGASREFSFSKFLEDTSQRLFRASSFIYISGFFLTVCARTARSVAVHAQEAGKQLILDLGAPRVCWQQTDTIRALLPFVDVLVGNDTEITALGQALNMMKTDVCDICTSIVKLPKIRSVQSRIVVMTRGPASVLVATADGCSFYPIITVPAEHVVDVSGAGDAFLGGFLSQYIQDMPVDKCVTMGLHAASVVVQQSGCTFPTNAPAL
ncbi:uncharacterized protein LOC129587477 isoform X2 [Paramacrobiotus metropolitanus]|uniref:uncharacterized protein LOC129587477 isoform X2 n=1 Tax=Paramacrobiotus metropolitanus TaxID=2943436 RepID=UPI0024464AE1|nr:uncharacterized protein LOC129587477 isoform X2 [Paramacrobiotus metropolitanus]XP_055337257.1 uncharacterized protein LOC129587477 isoform X2 [Paramacrobiotus metropolitanus]